VNASLSARQRDALDNYYQLLDNYPDLFSGRDQRPIVRETATLEAFAAEHQVVLGVACETPYLWLINDLVQSSAPSGATVLHPYLRLIAPPQLMSIQGPGVVVLATVEASEGGSGEKIVLVEQERHATGRRELELPRGFGEPGIPPEEQALRELRQETGYRGTEATCLGTTLTDSGSSDSAASFFHVRVTAATAAEPEAYEAIIRHLLMSRDELWARIDSGEVHDAFTVQALALYERHAARNGLVGRQ
jgi:ADP-ribose pyrophosphatase